MATVVVDVVKALEMWLKLIKKPERYVDPDLDPVLLVPGIAGSILQAVDENGKSERVWVRIIGADYKFRTKLWSRFDPSTALSHENADTVVREAVLYGGVNVSLGTILGASDVSDNMVGCADKGIYETDGKTMSLDPKTKVMVPEDRYGLYAIDVLDPDMILGTECVYYFHDMITEMIKWGFQEGKTLFGFGYDFRQSNRLEETMECFAAKLESVYTASGGKRINLISHSMGGLLVKCFMSLHSDVFEKYVRNWIAISAPFQGAPGYITSTFLNGCSFVDGWEENFFISKWSMHQLLVECPSIYELMACPKFNWQHAPRLEIWRERQDDDGNSYTMLESYTPEESISIFKDALSNNKVDYDGDSIPLPYNIDILRWANETKEILQHAKVPPQVKFYNIYGTSLETPHSVCYGSEDFPVSDLEQLRYFQAKYIYVDGDGTVPTESAKVDGLNAVARVGVPADHRGILSDHHVFRILKHWLKAGQPDPFYDPLNDFVILPTAFEIEKAKERLQEEWEVISRSLDNQDDMETEKHSISFLSVSEVANADTRITVG